MAFTAGAWKNLHPFTSVLEQSICLSRKYSTDIGTQKRVLDDLIWFSRNYSMDIGTKRRVLEHLIWFRRNCSMDIGTKRRALDHLIWLSRNCSMGIGTQKRLLDHLIWLSRNYSMDIGTQRSVLDHLIWLSRKFRMDIGTQRSVLDHLIWLSRKFSMDIGTQRSVLDHLIWLSRNYSMDIGTQRSVLDHLIWFSRNYSMDIGTKRRPFVIFFGGPWTEEKLKKELHNQYVEIGTQNTKSCLPSLPSGEQCTEVLHEEKRHVKDEDFPIQNQHEDYGPNSAKVITQDNTKPEVKPELAETSGRGHDMTALLCLGVGKAAKNLMNTSFSGIFFTLCLMSITIVQPIHSLHIEMANQTIHFGEDVILECSFQQKENNQSLLMQWYKGNSDRLTQGRTSSNDEKYTVDLIQPGILNRYILTIRNLSVEDFDTYTCHHNFESTSFALYPSQTLFVYIPSEKEITASVTDDRGLKKVTFSNEDIEKDDGSINLGSIIPVCVAVVMLFIAILVIICWIKTSKRGRTANEGTSCATDEHKKMLA